MLILFVSHFILKSVRRGWHMAFSRARVQINRRLAWALTFDRTAVRLGQTYLGRKKQHTTARTRARAQKRADEQKRHLKLNVGML